jgi:ABC-2 type transport system ATP-binding protein
VSAQPEHLVTALHELTGWALQRGITLDDLHILRPSLEDIYLKLTATAIAAVDGADRLKDAAS